MTEWLVTKALSDGLKDPRDEVVPYSAWVVAGSLVVQLIVAPLVVTLPVATPEITGGVVSGGAVVVNVWSEDVARLPAASLLFTRK